MPPPSVATILAGLGAAWLAWRLLRRARLKSFEDHVTCLASQHPYLSGEVEHEYFDTLHLHVRPGMVIVDAGAHYGMFALSCFVRAKRMFVLQ